MSDDETPPWRNAEFKGFRPELLPPVDPAEFRAAVHACMPREWPKGYPVYWSQPVSQTFGRELMLFVRAVETKWTPIQHRFLALLRLLEDGQLGPGWPTEEQLIKDDTEFKLHPAILHTAAQLPIKPDGDFDAVEFRRAFARTAKSMGLALPAGVTEAGAIKEEDD